MAHFQWTVEGTSHLLSDIAAFACNILFQLCVQACPAVDSKTIECQLNDSTFKMKKV